MEFQNICNEMVAQFFAPPYMTRRANKMAVLNTGPLHHETRRFFPNSGRATDNTHCAYSNRDGPAELA